MPQITKLWFFASASLYSANPLKSSILPFNPSFSSSSTFKSKTHQIFFAIPPRFTLFSASARSKIHHRRNSNSTLRNTKTGEKGAEMEANESQEFNKRRAEGRDKGERKALQLKTRKLNPVSTICYAQILGTGMDTQDTSPSVFLFFDKQRFIFNAGEGFQRFCTEHKVKLSKIDHVFLTRVCSETAGGLPGLLLTLAGIGDDGMSVNLWGPSDLKYLIDAMRSFIPNAAMVHTHSFGPEPLSNSSPGILADPIVLIDDEVVKISAILLRPSCSTSSPNLEDIGSSANCSSDLEGKMDEFSGHLTLNSQSSPKNVEGVLKPGDIAVIYVCELPEIMGKFDPEKAKALGLKPGPKYRELQLGNSVMSDRQNVMVHPSDVLGPSSPGPIVVLVDCSTLSHLQELLSVQSLHRYYVDSTDCNGDDFKTVNCIIHLGPSSVTTTTVYQKWMKRFGGAQHIMAGHEMKNIEVPILKASARIASRLNYLCPQFFPAPGFWSLKDPNNFPMNSLSSSKDASSMLCQSIPAENLLKFVLRPYANLGLNRTDIPSTLTASEVISELHSEIPEIVDASKNVRQLWHDPGEAKTLPPMLDSQIIIEEPWMDGNACIPCTNLWEQNGDALQEEIPHLSGCETGAVEHDSDIPSCLENVTREDMEIVLLGTGSSQPSKYRNVSSIYVNLFSKGSVLLDCGEGTLAQLKRRFGVKGADDAVKGLKFIWISHIHADHHTGLARILSLRTQLLRGVPHEPLLVIGPKQLKRFLDAYSRLEDLDMHFLDCRHTTKALIDAYEDSLESSIEHSSMHNSDDFAELGPADSVNLNKRDERFGGALGMALSRKLETTLFAGGRMQSYWNRPGSQGETAIDIPGIKKLKEVLCNAGLEALISVPVVHCPQAFGVVLKAVERNNLLEKIIPGWSLVYSGDTRPCQSLIDASHGATVLIHEATFEDSMVEEAVARNHSTTKEAIEVGTSAGAYRVILTHFSQRYPKIPVFDETHMQKTCIAFDMMSVNLADLPVLPKVLPYLKLLFRNEMVGDEERDISVAP